MRLHWHPLSVMPRRVRIVVREKNLACDEVEVDLPGGAQHQAPFRKLNPFGQVPVLEDGDLVLAESIAILEYLEERHPAPPLLPSTPAARGLARQFMLWSGDDLMSPWHDWLRPLFTPGADPADPSVGCARERFAHHLDVLEAQLAGRAWLIDDYSLADVCYAPFLTAFPLIGLGDLFDTRPAVRAWIDRLAVRPAVRATQPPAP